MFVSTRGRNTWKSYSHSSPKGIPVSPDKGNLAFLALQSEIEFQRDTQEKIHPKGFPPTIWIEGNGNTRIILSERASGRTSPDQQIRVATFYFSPSPKLVIDDYKNACVDPNGLVDALHSYTVI